MDRVGSREMRMLQYCTGISLDEHRRNEETSEAKIMPIKDVMRKRRFGHVCCHKRYEDTRRVYEVRVEKGGGHGRFKQRWHDTVSTDLRWLDLDESDMNDE